VADNEASPLKAVTDQQKSFFLVRMIRIIDQTGVLVEKDSLSFLEGDTMFGKIRTGLS